MYAQKEHEMLVTRGAIYEVVEHITGHIEYYKDERLHREDGPARISPSGKVQWFLNGIKYTEKEFKEQVQKCK
jgi:hypothetical protein